jgi:thioesterase domain-containing protein/acyl carrier protein
MPGRRAYILDARGNPVPVGVPGELCLGGEGSATGYLNRPADTAEKFLPDPFAETPGARMYRAGDRARRRNDGQIEFLGRMDRQIKLRGYRIEPGEIEAALCRHAGVTAAAVVLHRDGTHDPFLAAYVVPAASGAAEPEALRAHLRQSLPDYMVPSTFTRLDAMPLTTNRKPDLSALPPPAPPSDRRDGYLAPRNRTEMTISAIWERLLHVERVGVRDDFFALGGHSLIAVGLLVELEQEFGRKLAPGVLLETPTVEGLAAGLSTAGGVAAGSRLVALRSGGERPPLFLLPEFDGGGLRYRELAPRLGPNIPVYAWVDRGGPDDEPVESRARRFVEDIRAVRPHGPYCVGGLSFGGITAFEAARRLAEAGEAVDWVVLFDTAAPGFPRRRTWWEQLMRHWGRVRGLSLSGMAQYAAQRMRDELGVLGRRVRRAAGMPEGNRTIKDILDAARALGAKYRPGVYAGRVLLLRAQVESRDSTAYDRDDPIRGWGRFTTPGRLHVADFPVDHFAMLKPPALDMVAAELRARLGG